MPQGHIQSRKKKTPKIQDSQWMQARPYGDDRNLSHKIADDLQ